MEHDPVAVLRRAFGYPGFRPGQEELVRSVLGGRDALGVLPTGGGKSVCYQVPAFLVDGLTLVVTPWCRSWRTRCCEHGRWGSRPSR